MTTIQQPLKETVYLLALVFTRRLREELGASQFADVCFNEYNVNRHMSVDDLCDPNQTMIDAHKEILGREPWFPCNADEGLATMEQVDADFDLMELAWDKARLLWAMQHLNTCLEAKGYSPLNSEQQSLFLKEDAQRISERNEMIADIEARVFGNA